MADSSFREQRRLRAQAAAFEKHARHDPAIACATARAALWAKYYAQVDPNSILELGERTRRARAAMRADLCRRRLEAVKRRQEEADAALADELLVAAR